MRSFVDFAALKESVSFESAIGFLDLQLKRTGAQQWRGACPCGRGGDRALVVTEREGFFCQGAKRGGDVISLAAHVLDVRMKEAAIELAERAGFDAESASPPRKATVPESERSRSKGRSPRGGERSPPHQFDADAYAAKLDYEHELLIEAGGDPEKLRAFGVGFTNKGIHRGKIVARITDPSTGESCFVPLADDFNLPPQLRTNVVSLPVKRSA